MKVWEVMKWIRVLNAIRMRAWQTAEYTKDDLDFFGHWWSDLCCAEVSEWGRKVRRGEKRP